MKLKGHCKIELKDKRTGKIEQYEEHNMVTEGQNAKGILHEYCWGNEYPS